MVQEDRQNLIRIPERLTDVIDRHCGGKKFEIFRMPTETLIKFQVQSWTSENLHHILYYVGVDEKIWLKTWHIDGVSKQHILVMIWIIKDVDMKTCEHTYYLRKDWGNVEICSKCGYFHTIEKDA